MNKLRNGGFDRGNFDFWGELYDCTGAVVTASPHRGTHCLELTSTNVGGTYINHGDYIPVEGYELIDVSENIKATVANDFTIRMLYYDDDLTLIASSSSRAITGTGMWQELRSNFKAIPEAVYVKPQFRYDSTGIGQTWKLDTTFLNLISLDNLIISEVVLASLTNKTASGDTSDDPKPLLGFKDYYADLSCTSLTGTTPTLDIDVCDLDWIGNEVVLGSFTQLNGVGSERIKIDPPINDQVYVKYTEGGTWTDCDFKVNLTGVR